MKRMIIIGLLLLMSMSIAMAQPVKVQNQTAAQIREHIESANYYGQSNVEGLEQAKLMVQTATAAQQVEHNIEQMTVVERIMLQNMEQVRIALGENDTAVVQGTTRARFLGLINVNREMTMVVNEEGEVARIGRPLDFLFRYQETIRETQVE